MANLASSAVTLVDSWYLAGMNGKKFRAKRLTIVLTGQGGTTNKILATALGFTTIHGCSNAVLSDDSQVIAANPSYDGSYILLKSSAITNAAANAASGDYTGVTMRITVWGN